MTQNGWNPWKITAIGMSVVVATALVTGLVVANWTGTQRDRAEADQPQPKPARVASATPATPGKSAIEACNRYAASEAGRKKDTQDKAVEVVKGAAMGGLVGAGAGTLYGLSENKKSDERYRAAYASCMRARGYAS
jgi:hypothetical protein